MARWLFLAFLNFLSATTLFHTCIEEAQPPGSGLLSGLLFSILMSLGFPLAFSLYAYRFAPGEFLLLLSGNSFVWAAIVEALLRRFVDLPPNSSAE